MDLIIKLVGAGAVGVAAIMLLLSHQAFREVVGIVSKTPSQEQLRALGPLTADLRDHRRNALIALVIAAIVQLAGPVLDRLFPPLSASYPLAIAIDPTDDLPKDLMPAVSQEGTPIKPAEDRIYRTHLTSKSNLNVRFDRLMNRVNELQRLNVNVLQAQVTAAHSPVKGDAGFDPAP